MDPSFNGPTIEFRLLGTFQVVARGGRVLEIGSPKQRAILALLVLHLNHVVPRDALIEELWGASPPASATATVHSLVSRLRGVLTEAGVAGAAAVLRAREPGYVLEGDPQSVDARRFDALIARARDSLAHGDPEGAVRMLEPALSLWRGQALVDLPEVSAAAREAERLSEARLTAVEDLAEAQMACGRTQEAVAVLEPHVADHPFRERACAQLMLALYRLGRQAEALAVFRRVRAVIVDELGVEPTPALRGLEEQILHQVADLEGPGPRTADVATDRARRRPPDDTVAFLFTDIEASTRRWEGDREAMALDLARHDTIIRSHVESAGGEVFTHTGDGLAAVFPAASAAIAAATAGQRALLGERWATGGQLRVRMAVHAGTAERRGGNYFGPALNRASRLMAVAHGGQMLCSGAAADLLADDLPPGITLLDLGAHGLADLDRPERIFQVGAVGLPSAFPPLRTSGAQRCNLTSALTPFVGRVSELEQLRDLLRATRLLTLTGVGGAGKTRLALELAADVLGTFPDGAWIVELGPLRDGSLVVTGVAAVLGIPMDGLGAGSDRAEDHLCAQLHSRRLLIVLDNCEHLIDPAARLVHMLLAHCPEVTVIATSREVLGVDGEVVRRVPPMSLPPPEPTGVEELRRSDAVTLFCERSRAVQPGFALSPSNATAVAQICRRLDGIPLALELAAARIRVLSAHQVAERLDDRFRLLTGGTRTAVPRHQTLRAAMDWSYAALPPAEQGLLRRLSVFPASFDLEAAEAVGPGDDDNADARAPGFEVLDLLARLVDKSLVVVQAEGTDVRYRLLETVRQYAAERLAEAGEARSAHRRHRDHFLRSADWGEVRWWPNDQAWLRRAEADEDSFRAALSWSLAEGDGEPALQIVAGVWLYWMWAGRPDGVGWLERALAAAPDSATPARVEALVGLAASLFDFAAPDPDRSERLLREALTLAERIGDVYGRNRARYLLAEVALTQGDPAQAQRILTGILVECGQDKVMERGWFHYGLGNVAVVAGDLTGAASHFEQALALARSERLVVLIPQALSALAPLAALCGPPERAMALADEAVHGTARLGWRRVRSVVLVRASEAMILAHCVAPARDVVRQLLELLRGSHGRGFVADALENAALILAATDQPAAAMRLLSTCEVIRQADNQPFGGTRAVSGAVRDCSVRMQEALSPRQYEEEAALGREATSADAIAFALFHLDSATS